MKRKGKQKSIKNLVKKALNDGWESKPSQGYIYLESLDVGESFETEFGTIGIHIKTEVNSTVIVLESPIAIKKEDKRYYLGKHQWSSKTQVRRLK